MNDWDQDIYHLNDDQPQPTRGSLLVAKPTVGDFFFKRSLVLIVDPDEGEGAMGVVTNHYMGYNLRDIMPEIETVEEIPLFLGGPVGTEMLFYMHTLGPEVVPNAISVGDGVWFGGDFDAIKRYVELGGPVAIADGAKDRSHKSWPAMTGLSLTRVIATFTWVTAMTNSGERPCPDSEAVTACGSICPVTRHGIRKVSLLA